MDEKGLKKSLDSVVEQLKKVADILSTSTGVKQEGGKSKLKSTLNDLEKNRVKTTATITANVYKSILGLGFNAKEAKDTAKEYDSYIGFKSYFSSSTTYLDSMAKTLTAFYKAAIDNPYSDYFEAINNSISQIKVTSSTAIADAALGSINKNISDIKDYLDSRNSEPREELIPWLDAINNNTILVVEELRDFKAKQAAMFAPLRNVAAKTYNYNNVFKRINDKLASIDSRTFSYKTYFNALENAIISLKKKIVNVNYSGSFTSVSSLLRKIEGKLSTLINPSNKIYTIPNIQRNTIISKLDRLVSINQTIASKNDKVNMRLQAVNIIGLTTFGAALFLVIQALAMGTNVDLGKSLKIVAIVTSFVGLFVLLSKNSSQLKEAAIGVSIFSATMVGLTGALALLSSIPAEALYGGLYRFLGAVGVSMLVLIGMKKIGKTEVQNNSKGLLYLVGSVLAIVGSLVLLSQIPWAMLLVGLVYFTGIVGVCWRILKAMENIKKTEVESNSKGLMYLVGAVTSMAASIALLSLVPWPMLLFGLAKFAGLILVSFGIIKMMEKVKEAKIKENSLGLLYLIGAVTAITLGLMAVVHLPWQTILLGLAKVGVIFLSFAGLMKISSMIDAKSSAKSLLVMLGSVLLLTHSIIPALKQLSDMNWKDIAIGLISAIGIFTVFSLFMDKIGQFVSKPSVLKNILVAGLVFSGLSLVSYLMISGLKHYVGVPFGEISMGLIQAGIALSLFGALMTGVGALVVQPQILLLMAAGSLVMIALKYVAINMISGMQEFAGKPWDEILSGIQKASLSIVAFGGAMTLIGMVSIPIFFASLVMPRMMKVAKMVPDSLTGFAGRQWDQIIRGLKQAAIAVGIFSSITAAVGLFSFFISSGNDVLSKMITNMGSMADALEKYASIDGENLSKVGEGMENLSRGLLYFFGGSFMEIGAGVIQKIEEFFNIDIPSKLKKYQEIDGGKLSSLGKGLKDLGVGLAVFNPESIAGLSSEIMEKIKSIFEVDIVSKLKRYEEIDSKKLDTLGQGLMGMSIGLRSVADLNYDDLNKKIELLKKPLMELSGVMDAVSNSYDKFNNVVSKNDNKLFKLIFDSATQEEVKRLNSDITEMHKLELFELKRSADSLQFIQEWIKDKDINQQSEEMGGGYGQILPINTNSQKESIRIASFSNKRNYMNNIEQMNSFIS